MRPLFATALIGLVVGLVAVAFAASAEGLIGVTIFASAALPLPLFAGCALGLMTLGAAVAGWLMHRYAPDAAGSGIPQVKVAYHRGEPDFTWRLVFVKFVGGVLSIGTGSSLGREGPTVHLGAALASKIVRRLHESPEGRLNAVCAGSAAGLAAAFNSPLAGVALVLEEIAGGANQNKFAGRTLLAAALAVLVVYLVLGNRAALPVAGELPLHWRAIWLAPVAALVAGLAGVAFQLGTLRLRAAMKASPIPRAWRPAVGAALASLAGVAAFAATGHLGVFGLGEQDLLATLQNRIVWGAAAVLLVAKLVATVLCYGTGGCGGIFAPLIFFGGMAGTVVAGGAAHFVALTPADHTMLALTGMTACLCATVRAPITSILIVMEMTLQLQALPALMVAAVIGAFLNRYLCGQNLYDAALAQDGVNLDQPPAPRPAEAANGA